MTGVRIVSPATPARAALAVDLLAVVAVGIAGATAAHLVMPVLWIVTPIVAATLFVAAVHAARRQRAPTAAPVVPLAPRVERSVADAFAALPAGEARDLLGDVVHRARTLLDTATGNVDDGRLVRDVTDLVDACCEIAREHARLDAVLPALWEPALAPAAARGTADDMNADELRRRGDAGRQLLTRRLGEAAAAMEAMAVQQGVERSGSAAQRVAELTSELVADAAARRHAAQEIQRLMEGKG